MHMRSRRLLLCFCGSLTALRRISGSALRKKQQQKQVTGEQENRRTGEQGKLTDHLTRSEEGGGGGGTEGERGKQQRDDLLSGCRDDPDVLPPVQRGSTNQKPERPLP